MSQNKVVSPVLHSPSNVSDGDDKSRTGAACISGAEPPFIVVEVYENQRWFPISKWTSAKRLPTDRPTFSNKSGSEERDLSSYKLPHGYAWGSLPNTPLMALATTAVKAAAVADEKNKEQLHQAWMEGRAPNGVDNKNNNSNGDKSTSSNTSAQVPAEHNELNTLDDTIPAGGSVPNTCYSNEIIANSWQIEISKERTDKEGWRYAVDYRAHYGKEMHHTSLVRRRKYVRTAVFVGGSNSPDDCSFPYTTTTTADKAGGVRFASDGVGACNGKEGFVCVNNNNNGGKADEGEAAKRTAEAEKEKEPKFGGHTSEEAQRQAALAALASMKRQEAVKAEEAKYFPKDNSCADAADNGEEFTLPTTFEKGGKGARFSESRRLNTGRPRNFSYASFNSGAQSSVNVTAQNSTIFGFQVPEGPYMALSPEEPQQLQFSSQSETFSVPPHLFDTSSGAVDGVQHTTNATEQPVVYLGGSAGTLSPSRTKRLADAGQNSSGQDGQTANHSTDAATYFGAAAGAVISGASATTGGGGNDSQALHTSTSAAEFDAVFKAFVSKEKNSHGV